VVLVSKVRLKAMNERVVHCKKERFDTYIGRPSLWGNPFRIGVHGTREECVEQYERYARSNPLIMAELEHVIGHTFGCWCGSKSCHGHVLIKLIREIEESRTK